VDRLWVRRLQRPERRHAQPKNRAKRWVAVGAGCAWADAAAKRCEAREGTQWKRYKQQGSGGAGEIPIH